MDKVKINKWQHTTDPVILRRLGKTGEELGELANVTNRIIIQGIDEVDPSSGEVNRKRLEDEIADVYAQLDCTVDALGLDNVSIQLRRLEKITRMEQWEDLYK